MRRVVSYFPFYSHNIDFVKGYNEGGIKICILQDAKSELEIKNIKDVRGNLTLPTRGKFGEEISWFSENPAIITISGEIIRLKYGEGVFGSNLMLQYL